MAVRFTFIRPLRLAAELHLYPILEYLLTQLYEIMARKWPQITSPIQVRSYLAFIKSDTLSVGALRMDYQVERLCLHLKDWKNACHKTLGLLEQYGLLSHQTESFGEVMTTITLAIELGNDEALHYFLQGYQIGDELKDIDENFPFTPIDTTLDYQRLHAFRELVRVGHQISFAKQLHPKHRLSPVEATFLHVCAGNRLVDLEFARVLLDHGVPPTVTDNRGFYPLSLAVMKGSFELAKLLIDRGASVNQVGGYGYTTLGLLLEPMMSAQCDDHRASIKFLLDLEGDTAPSFVVRQQEGVTALIIAASVNHDDPSTPEIFHLLLQKFGTPEHLNARATRESRSTALQAAVQAHNVWAVKALIKAGADVAMLDMEKNSMLDIATSSLQRLLKGESNLSSRDLDLEISRALETISLISEAGNWPIQFRWGESITRMLAVTKELREAMMDIPHWKSRSFDWDQLLGQTVAKHIEELPEELIGLEEFRRQLDRALQPLFFAELVFRIAPSFAVDLRTLGDRTSDTFDVITTKLPILRNLSRAAFMELQQAAAFEYLLDHLRTHPPTPKDESNLDEIPELRVRHGPDDGINSDHAWESFRTFAETGDETKLPIDYRYVRYPQPLLEWYLKAVDNKLLGHSGLTLDTEEDKGMVSQFIGILTQRKALHAKGIKPLPPFDSEFRAFHFRDLQGRMLRFKDLNAGLLCRWSCRCMRDPIGELAIEFLEYMDRCVDDGFEVSEQDYVHWHKKYKERLDHDVEASQWERSARELAIEESVEANQS